MLLNTVIIILQEVLEAALLVSVLLALSHALKTGLHWLFIAALLGFVGAYVFQHNLEAISSAFDYVGQEVTNAALQITVFFSLLVISYCLTQTTNNHHKLIIISMAVAVSLSVVREGSEIIIYVGSFLQRQEHILSVTIGAGIGIAIGASTAALLFYGITALRPPALILTTQLLLALIAASMLSQAAQQLIQADWLPAHTPVWDTSFIIDEQSIVGRLLYAIAGYEARPDILQLCAFITGLISILLFRFRKQNSRVENL